MTTETPKVFISYSWTNPDHENKVMELADRMRREGVDTLLDKWDLGIGQDRFKYMEQAVTNPDVKFVLLICDRVYTEKANTRKGGVGEETTIISSEVYGKANQEKFIPVIFELDEEGKPYIPAYVKSKIYINLSCEANYEIEYEKLLRHIHGKPLHVKPKLGSPPVWLEHSSINITPLNGALKRLQNSLDHKNKASEVSIQFVDQFIASVREIRINGNELGNGKIIADRIDELKPIRDIYLDAYKAIIASDIDLIDFTTTFFERFWNEVFPVEPGFVREHYEFLLWECFICTIALLFKRERFSEIHDILYHSYFLSGGIYRDEECVPFCHFRNYLETLERVYIQHYRDGKRITVVGDMLYQREKLPDITSSDIVKTDVVLCQLSYIYFPNAIFQWFPSTYVFASPEKIWNKLISRKYCQKVLPLFGVKTIDELKKIIQANPVDRNVRYPNAFATNLQITGSVFLDAIGSQI